MNKIQKKVLVADDDRDLLELLELLLPYNGYEVRTCSNGEEVISVIEEFKPDLILLDIHLGQEDGRHICQAIKTKPELAPIPVIMISADDESIYNTIISFGANDVIRKPFDYNCLTDRMERQIAQRLS
jgi:DNA-binding response OmpR family regulator